MPSHYKERLRDTQIAVFSKYIATAEAMDTLNRRCQVCRGKFRGHAHENCQSLFRKFEAVTTERLADPRLRRFILDRDGEQCRYCGQAVSMENAQIDHLIPWSRAGRTLPQNLVTSCRRCNLRKSAIAPTPDDLEWLLFDARPLIERFRAYPKVLQRQRPKQMRQAVQDALLKEMERR